jgi:tetratricopeptide (TPR) repeat protein
MNETRAPQATSKEQDGAGKEVKTSARKWMFRLAAMVFVPLLLLAGVEVLLRLVGYGYPTSFLLKTTIQGEEYFVPNEKFGFRFFPPAIARTPTPFRIRAQKPSGTFRICLFGESAALGDPDPSYGVARYLEVLLNEKFPGTRFEVVCAAMTAINSHALLPIARDMTRCDADLWLIYMGNNEMIGPYGASTVFGSRAPPLWVVRLSLAVQSTRLGQLLADGIGKLRGGCSAPLAWGGMKMFKEHELRSDDAARARASANFGRNLRDIVRVALRHRVPVVVSTVASNLKDCPPFASLHALSLKPEQLEAWARAYEPGKVEAEKNNDQTALQEFLKAAEIDPQFAELQFRLGTCYLKLNKLDEARSCFVRARDLDALAFRSDSRLEGVVRYVSQGFAGKRVYLVETARLLAERSPQGIPGEQWFYEHVHFNFDGNYQLARIFAEEIGTHLPAELTTIAKTGWADQPECEKRLAITPWDQHRLWQVNYSRVSEPPFTEQMNDASRARKYIRRLEEIQQTMNAEAQEAARALYERAVAARPEDPFLRGNFCQFLDSIGDLPRAIEQERKLHELLPAFPGPLHKLGVLSARQGNITEATNYFGAALRLRPDYVPALNELGLAWAHQQKLAEAENCFARAERLNRGYAETYLNRGFVKQSTGRMEQASEDYHRAAQLQAEGPAAHFERGVTMAMAHQRSEAIKAFQNAVWMNPAFWQARYLLGVELAGQEKVDEAAAQFREVIRLRPDLAKAHFNLGVAMGKQRKIDDALNEFRATVRLSPTNEAARKYIDSLEALRNRAAPQH